MDRGLKSIVAQQIRNLLKGGWPEEEIRTEAIALALRYDRFAGHKRMTSFAERCDVRRVSR